MLLALAAGWGGGGYVKPLLIVAFLLVPAICLPLFTESSFCQDRSEEALKLRTELVSFSAELTRVKTGTAVGDLTKEDFTVTEDGRPQVVSHFSRDEVPLSVLLLLDVSGSVQPIISHVAREGMNALAKLHPDDQVAIMAFGKWAMLTQDFTTDRPQLIRHIADIEQMGPWIREATYIDDAIDQGAQLMGKLPDDGRRKVIIVITDNLNNQPPDQGASPVAALKSLSRSNAVLCALIVGDFEAQVEEYRQRRRILVDSIGPYVTESGGLLTRIDKVDAVAKFGTLLERLRVRYSFAYTRVNPNHDGKFHRIKLSVSPAVEKREGKIQIKTRSGYFAPKDGSPPAASDKPVSKSA
jgi:Ca-activated chloride channel family protein